MKRFYCIVSLMIVASVHLFGQRALTVAGKAETADRIVDGLTLSYYKDGVSVAESVAVAQNSSEGIELGYCGDVVGALSVNAGQTGMAVRFPASRLAEFANGMITGIMVPSGVDKAKSTQENPVNSATKCRVFISKSLEGEPEYEQDATLSAEGFEWNEIELATPYELKEGESLYVGVMYDGLSVNDLVIVTDQSQPQNSYSGYLYSRFGGLDSQGNIELQDEYGWAEFAKYVGNLCVKARVVAEGLPLDRAYIMDSSHPQNVSPGKPFNFSVAVFNDGLNDISDVEVTMVIADEEPQTRVCDMMDWTGAPTVVSPGKYGLSYCEFRCDKEGNNIPFTAYISKVNGNDNDLWENKVSGYLLSLEEGYEFRLVGEMLTSTFCKGCPVAMSSVEIMQQKYGENDRFIPIEVHVDMEGVGKDPMCVSSDKTDVYSEFVSELKLAPSLCFNRHMEMEVLPIPSFIEDEVKYWMKCKAMAELRAVLSKTAEEGKAQLQIEMESAIDDENAYGFAYTIVEDGLGPYVQLNGYSGSSESALGWESKEREVECVYNNVARRGSVYEPIEGSLPESLVKGKVYEFATEVDLSHVSNLKNYRVVAMLVNKTTGCIENACVAPNPDTVSIETLSADTVRVSGLKGCMLLYERADVFGIDGGLVASEAEGRLELPSGIYIAVSGGRVSKVLVK